jgi:predicted PurR-regulated permease PerM
LGLFSWGAFELFMVDKFLRPRLIGRHVELPFLAVLFGLLGGVSTMGVLGLFIGPFLMAVLFWWLRDGRIIETAEGRTLAAVEPPETSAAEEAAELASTDVKKQRSS